MGETSQDVKPCGDAVPCFDITIVFMTSKQPAPAGPYRPSGSSRKRRATAVAPQFLTDEQHRADVLAAVAPSPSPSIEAALLDETVEMVLDTRHAVCEVLAESMPFEDLDRLLRELAGELLDTYRTVAAEDVEGAGR